MEIYNKYQEKLRALISEAGKGTWTESQRRNINVASNLASNFRWMNQTSDLQNRLYILNGEQKIAGLSDYKSSLMKEGTNYYECKCMYSQFTPNFRKYLDYILPKIENRTITEQEWNIFDCLPLRSYVKGESRLGLAARTLKGKKILDNERANAYWTFLEQGLVPKR